MLKQIGPALGAAQDSRSVYDAVAGYFDTLDTGELVAWNLSAPEDPAVLDSVAASNPDALVGLTNVLRTYFIKRGHFPRAMNPSLDVLKRLVASALAAQLPTYDAPKGKPVVVLMVPWLANNPNNNLLRVVAGYLDGLRRNGDVADVHVLVTNEICLPDDQGFQGTVQDSRRWVETHKAVWADYDIPDGMVTYLPPPFADGGNVAAMGKAMQVLKPNIVFVPNVEMNSCFIDGLGKSAATVYLQTSLRNRPPYDFDRYLYLGERREIDNTHRHPDRWDFHSFGYAFFGGFSTVSRPTEGFSDDDFILVSAGNRLEHEIDPEICKVVADVVASHPRVKWLMLGVRNEDAIRKTLDANFPAHHDHVSMRGYVPEIGDFLKMADLYVNPRRTGGAVSMALAVYGDTPVISFPMNDACNYIIDELICATSDEYGDQIKALVADPKMLARLNDKQRKHFETHHTVEGSAADLVGHFQRLLKS